MIKNPLQKLWEEYRYTTRRYLPDLWKHKEFRKIVILVMWRRPLLLVKWLFIIVGVIVIPILLVILILYGYKYAFTGFNEQQIHDPKQYQPTKTLWDWLQLLIIPAVLAVGGAIFNRLLDVRSRDIATDQQQQSALQNYLDEMSKLLTVNQLREPKPESPERDIARALTLTVLPGLDPHRKGRVLRFLYETGLIYKDNTIVDLRGANFSNLSIYETKVDSEDLEKTGTRISLRGANLQETIFRDASLELVDLSDACLENAYMSGADLSRTWLCKASMKMTRLNGSNLYQACLQGAQMQGVKMRWAYLQEADLRNVNLQKYDEMHEADLQDANLQKALLEDVKMQDVNLRGADLRGTSLTDEQRDWAERVGARS